MPRRLRKDFPGAWWHVMNRSVAGGLLFRDEQEGRLFLLLLARAVRQGWIEVHAYCLMPNHFHLEVRSPRGELAKALHWIEYRFARAFNGRNDRAGALFGGRYVAKLIHSLRYRRAGFVYIHRNPESAGLDGSSDVYWDSSEACHVTGRGHPWVSRSFGRSVVADRDAVPAALFERWLEDPSQDLPETDLLLKGSTRFLLLWLRRIARAPGALPFRRSLILPSTLGRTLRQFKREAPSTAIQPFPSDPGTWDRIETGLLQTTCALTQVEIAKARGNSRVTVRQRLKLHTDAVLQNEEYAILVSRVLKECLRQDYQSPA